MRLKNKVAVIPGGTAGIGREIALGYIREGATVVVASSTSKNVDKMSQEFKEMGHKGLSLVADITKRADVDRMVEETVKKFGQIDILVNCSGIFPATPFLEISEEELVRVMDINLFGLFRCAQAVAKEMVKRGSGSIINITSGQAFVGVPLMAHYTAAKGGLVSMTRAIASELSPLGIRVNAIAAGLTTTDKVTGSFPPEFLEYAGAQTALKRLAKPEDYVGTGVLLASEEGSYITGVTIPVDGGTINVAPSPVSGFSE